MKITKSTLKTIIQEEYARIKQNESEMAAYDRDDEPSEPSDSLKKIAGSDDLAVVLQTLRHYRGKNGSWAVKVVGESEFRGEYPDTDEGRLQVLEAWYRLNSEHPATVEWVGGI